MGECSEERRHAEHDTRMVAEAMRRGKTNGGGRQGTGEGGAREAAASSNIGQMGAISESTAC